jgi:hypothetical protein
LLSQRCLPMGWAVLLAIAGVVLTMVLMLLWFVASLAFRWQFRFSMWWLLVMTIAVAIPFSWLSQRFQWFAFDEKKDWAVFPSSASVILTIVAMPLWFVFLLALRFRWQFQFSIRTLLMLTVIVAISCSWMAAETKRAKGQREAVGTIRRLGGVVVYNHDSRNAYKPTPGPPPGPVWLRELLGDDFFASVALADLDRTPVADAELVSLQALPQVQNVSLSNTQITGAGLVHLKGLSELLMLSLDNTQITDAGLEYLKGMPQLVLLYLHNTKITDAGMVHLQGLNHLTWLTLDWTQVTDSGLEYLEGLTELKSLSLTGTKVTDQGVKKLQQALPKCNIKR